MKFIPSLLVISGLFISWIEADKTIRAPILRLNKPDPLISAIQKINGLDKRDPFAAALYNDAGSQYLIDVAIGTPPQNFSVTLDTGSADLWIPGSGCSQTDCPNGSFDSSASSTFKSLDKIFTLTYGVGNVNGTYVTDTVSVGGATIKSQQFGLASNTQSILTNQNTVTTSIANVSNKITSLSASTNSSSTPTANGIFGLGFPKLTAASSKGQGAYNPFVFNLVSEGIISSPVFSIYLNDASSTGWVGEIIFGGTDESKYSGNLTYLPVMSLSSSKKKRSNLPDNSSKYYWMVGAQGFAVTDASNSSKTLNVTFPNVGGYILDTGTTLTYLPSSMAKQVVEAVAGSNGYSLDSSSGSYIVDCNAAKSTTQFELKMTASNSVTDDPVVLSVPASSLVIPLDGKTAATSNYCLFGIAPTSSSLGDNLYLVGESLLRSTYLVFDMGNNRVGLAAANGANGSIRGVSANFETSNAVRLMPTYLLLVCLFITIFL